jgi:hypothetical protein
MTQPTPDPVDEFEGLDPYDRMLVADMEWNRPIYGEPATEPAVPVGVEDDNTRRA